MPETLTDLYRHLHAHPELGYAEHETAATAAERARAIGCEVTQGIGGTGVVAMLRNGPGPVVLLRADMDALPVEELTGLPYASTTPGLMHACGHDMHVTWLLGALEELSRTSSDWAGTVMAVFQPAEEGGNGAQAMVDDGLFERFGRPNVALGQHVTPIAAGTSAFCAGPMMAATDAYQVKLFGRGGHGSAPQTTIDPIVMAASAVMRLQTVVSREIAAIDPAVLSVGYLHAGTKSNIIPAEAELGITLRSYASETREKLIESMMRIIRAEAAASGATREPEFISVGSGYPVLVNDPQATELTGAALRTALGDSQVKVQRPIMGAEDFGTFGRAAGVPSFFWFTGGADPQLHSAAEAAGRLDEDLPNNHSAFFAPVIEPTLATGIHAMTTAARAWLG